MRIFLLCVSVLLAISVCAQVPDPQLLAEINKIKAVDNHSHPPRLVGPGEKDDEFDALPCDPLEPSALPTTLRPENPRFLAAWKALYGYKYDDMSPQHVRELMETKKQVMTSRVTTSWCGCWISLRSTASLRIASRWDEDSRFRAFAGFLLTTHCSCR